MTIKTGTPANDKNIQGSNGSDYLYGLAGHDILHGNSGADLLSGGLGNDILEGAAGADALNGGEGKDAFFYSAYKHADNDKIIDFSIGDTLDFSKISSHRFIGNQAFSGIAGEIRYDYQPEYLQGAIPFTTLLDKTTVEIDSDGDGEADVFLTVNGRINFVEAQPKSGKLIFAQALNKIGTDGSDKIIGASGNDTLSGWKGNDTLLGGEGNDRLLGGVGTDTLDGGFGLDTLTGGGGNDIFRFSDIDGSSYESITDFADKDQVVITVPVFNYIGDKEFTGVPGEYRFYQGSDSFDQSRIEFDLDGDMQVDAAILFGGNFATMVQETKAGSRHLVIVKGEILTGTAGNDTRTAANGNDTLDGLAGNDKLNGGMGNDSLKGGAGNDTLNAGSGNDMLKGDAGADVLIGGQGVDTLTGGVDKDVFRFLALADVQSPGKSASTFAANDTITDFASGDKIDLAGIDADVNQNKDQKFTFINSKNFSGTAGELRYDSANNLLQGDINGDTEADFHIEITGVTALTISDLVL